MIEHSEKMQAEYCLFFDVRFLHAISRIYILQVMVSGGFVSVILAVVESLCWTWKKVALCENLNCLA